MTVEKLYNILCTPALVVHELLHYVFIKLTLSSFRGIAVDFDENHDKNGRMSVYIYSFSERKFQTFLIYMSPFIGMFLWMIPYFMGMKILAIISIIYTILCAKVIMPSREDFMAIQNFGK